VDVVVLQQNLGLKLAISETKQYRFYFIPAFNFWKTYGSNNINPI